MLKLRLRNDAHTQIDLTYDNLEDEVTRHQTEFQTRVLRNAFELSQQPQHNGEKHHEDRQGNRGEDTLDINVNQEVNTK